MTYFGSGDSEPEEAGGDEQEVEQTLQDADTPMDVTKDDKEEGKRACADCPTPSHEPSTGAVILIPISELFVKSLLV